MIRRLALTAGFAILGAVAFAPNAQAQTADADTEKAPVTEMVPFSGKVESSCIFNFEGQTTKPGFLGLSTDGKTLSSEANTGGDGATPADTTIYCYGPTSGTISVGDPIATGTTITSAGDLDVVAQVSNGSGTATSEDKASFDIEPDQNVNLTVNMTITSTKRLPAGQYSYDVPIMATPN